MIYTMDLTRGSQVVNSGIPGSPNLWISLNDPIGTFRFSFPPGTVVSKATLHHFGSDDGWHRLEDIHNPFDNGSWWVRHVSWTKVEVEYRN